MMRRPASATRDDTLSRQRSSWRSSRRNTRAAGLLGDREPAAARPAGSHRSTRRGGGRRGPSGGWGRMTQAELTDVSRYYDLLDLWTRLNRGFRAFSGLEAGAIHRWLDDPVSGEFSPATIHNVMLASGIDDRLPV